MLHAREDYNRIQDPARKIPKEEPVFLLRAQDELACKAVDYYAFLCSKAQAPEVAAMAWEHAEKMRLWPKKKTPDLPSESCPAAVEEKALPVQAFSEWLNCQRDLDVSQVFHNVVAHYRAALTSTSLAAPLGTPVNGEDASMLVPGPLYEVTHAHSHKTLKAGDRVRMVQDLQHCNALILCGSWMQLHPLHDDHGQYVHLKPVFDAE